ncbi:alpha/beta fold hydrolase [bacterium]|nr:alpha/beta fold hydrolase [bacterium]
MKPFASVLFLEISLLSGLWINVCAQEHPRETVRDRIISVQDSVCWEIPDVAPWCEQLGMDGKMVNIGDCRLYVEERGRGVPLVLLHGGPGGNHHSFHPAFEEASRFCRVIYYDQRGCGKSDYSPGAGYSVDQAVSDLEALRESLHIERWVVLGHSYGGFLAQYYTMNYPHRVLGLVLCCSSTGLHNVDLIGTRQYDFLSDTERAAMKRARDRIRARAQTDNWPLPERIRLEIFNNFANGDWKRQYFYRLTLEECARIAHAYGNDSKHRFIQVMSGSEIGKDLTGAFTHCPIPTIIFESFWDLTWKANKAWGLAANHPRARVEMFSESGHNPFTDQPDKFFASLSMFLVNLEPASNAAVAAWKADLNTRTGCGNDPLLSALPSEEEKSAIMDFTRRLSAIREGSDYFSLDSPLDCLLSYYTAATRGDSLTALKARGVFPVNSGYLRGIIRLVEKNEVWRAPQPPERPYPAQVWPVYVRDRESGDWSDTILFQYWKGHWYHWGNNGGPFWDWRYGAEKKERDFLITRTERSEI